MNLDKYTTNYLITLSKEKLNDLKNKIDKYLKENHDNIDYIEYDKYDNILTTIELLIEESY